MSYSNEPATYQAEEANVLTDLYPENQLEDASMGQRFANYLIDVVGYYLFSMLVGVFLGVLEETGAVESVAGIVDNGFISILFSLLIYLIYMTLCEGLSGGKSLGKLITGTRAVREDGSRITFTDALRRSLCRIVPFEQFSIFFAWKPWHDDWTNTMVIKKQRQ